MPVADPLLFPLHPTSWRAVTQDDALDESRESLPVESIAFTQIWNAFPKEQPDYSSGIGA
jgi:hypothetical protein